MHFSEWQPLVPADDPYVPRNEQGGPELVEEPAGEIILQREVQADEPKPRPGWCARGHASRQLGPVIGGICRR